MKRLLLIPFAAIAFLASCASNDLLSNLKTSSLNSHRKFVLSPDYRQTNETYVNHSALKKANKNNTKLVVNIATQRLIVSEGSTVLIDTPCTTGRLGKGTPTGTFQLHDKVANKKSNIYGTFYQGSKPVCSGHRFEDCSGVSGRFVGTKLQYWQRLTSGGIGLHASNIIRRRPASGGCIRVHPAYAKKIFYLTKPSGTPITIFYS